MRLDETRIAVYPGEKVSAPMHARAYILAAENGVVTWMDEAGKKHRTEAGGVIEHLKRVEVYGLSDRVPLMDRIRWEIWGRWQ